MEIKHTLKMLAVSCSLAMANAPANALVITSTDNASALAGTLTAGTGLTVTSATISYGTPGDAGEFGPQENIPEEDFEGEFFDVEELPSPAPVNTDVIYHSAGTYSNTNGTYGLPTSGIVLSSGDVRDYGDGDNTENGKTTEYGNTATAEQSALLDPITSDEFSHHDVTLLTIEFDVDVNTDTISFLGVFGSEEFPDFVGSQYVDGFGLYLNGQNIAGALASNAEAGESAQALNINHFDMSENIEGTELNAVIAPNGNPLLRFDAAVEAGSTGNVFQIIISDTSDGALDSTAYLAAFGGEGSNEFIPVLPSNGEADENGEFHFELPATTSGLGVDEPIWIDPVVAIGYTYTAENGVFTSVTMPSLATVNDVDGYELWLFDGTDFIFSGAFAAGERFDFLSGVNMFRIMDITPNLELDPFAQDAFPIGITYDALGTDPVHITMKAVEFDTDAVNVPEPSSLLLMSLSLAMLPWAARRKKKVA